MHRSVGGVCDLVAAICGTNFEPSSRTGSGRYHMPQANASVGVDHHSFRAPSPPGGNRDTCRWRARRWAAEQTGAQTPGRR
jgi:hypothetical protein